ncbi:S-adenosyl-L-methionine-dependent methyltransferase [Daldinia decipiens]|uniref:S-adenosyl-L-methionine-dependent methyltransferase n=1 Tax=Daldinia decipiens TaxID=326647 RepID=UPI0020C4A26F|nr:S-adenosyl-L-methionine-dependent methyltransferase [Daldinia decipiens]KAI1662790.1 S-adenosyl-L-methionine-dependent methyltransferase [Daldinia decipiens]
MEDKMAGMIALPPGSQVLDAGCGVGPSPCATLRGHGLRVDAIDVVDHHVAKAQRNVERSGLPKRTVRVCKIYYHNLDKFAADSFDGVYTMENLVYATHPKRQLLPHSAPRQPSYTVRIRPQLS